MAFKHFISEYEFLLQIIACDGKKVTTIPPIYNTDKSLSFLLHPEKLMFYPNEVMLHFSVNVPGEYILENQAAEKLFDSLEIQINGKKRLTVKSKIDSIEKEIYDIIIKTDYFIKNYNTNKIKKIIFVKNRLMNLII